MSAKLRIAASLGPAALEGPGELAGAVAGMQEAGATAVLVECDGTVVGAVAVPGPGAEQAAAGRSTADILGQFARRP